MSRPDFEPLAWANRGISRDEAERLYDAGFDLADAAAWRGRFGTHDALRWRAAGVTTLREARAWLVAGVNAVEVAGWQQAGIGFAEAAAWHEFGYSLAEARELKAKGHSPSEAFRQQVKARPSSRLRAASGRSWLPAQQLGPRHRFLQRMQGSAGQQVLHGYFHRRWWDDEALRWAEHGIDAGDALVWKTFGIEPPEAAKLEQAGATAAGTMHAWWEAGIPPGEVAAWLGAGLTAEEAAAQRAAGVTVDRAAVLRALRDADGPD
jgi:hypothetical protein